jgi:hypothetical protein
MNLIRKPLAVLLALSLALWPVTAMATDDLWSYDAATPGNNTSIGGVSFAENMPPGNVNDGVRMLISQVKRAVANKGTDIASSSSTAICATGTSGFAHITGTTAITSFGTAAAGCSRLIVFDDALTLTHNATSLKLPGGINITTAANDAALAVSEGSGNWHVLFYLPAAGGVVGGFASVTATSTDAGATAGPDMKAFRNSASPADNDFIGRYLFNGRDESANEDEYASIDGQILDATGGTEDAEVEHKTKVAGTSATRMIVGQGVQVGAAATGGDCGTGCLNADTDVRLDGVSLAHGVAQVVRDTEATYTTLGTIIPSDNSIPQNTEGDEVLSVAITPKSASSTLQIDIVAHLGGNVADLLACAVFVDTTASAIAVGSTSIAGGGIMETISFNHSVSAASTSARTYKVRCGADSASDGALNGNETARLFGGVAISSLTVTEYLP